MRQIFSARGMLTARAMLLSALLLSAGCGKKEKIRELPPVPVTVERAKVKDMPLQINTFGKVEAYSQIPVKTMISGQISRFLIKPGDYVKKGDILLEIDRRPFEAVLQQCQAALAKDRIQLEDFIRQAEMKERLLASSVVDSNSTKIMRAQAESQRAQVLSSEAAVKNAQLNLEYCTIKAPLDGRAGDILVYEGTVVKANDVDVIQLVQLKPIYVVFAPPQLNLPEIQHFFKQGKLMVHAQVPVKGGAEADGELTFIDSVVNPTSGTVKLKATFPNEDMQFWPGQFVNVTLTLTVEKNCVVAPSQAVSKGQDGSYVFIVKPDSSAEYRPVKAGRSLNDETIILEGLNGNEKVITDGQVRLYPGARVYEPARSTPAVPSQKENSNKTGGTAESKTSVSAKL
jgi:multidrug efflux system membrane fusion protein